MAIEGFDYDNFTEQMVKEAEEIVPAEFSDEDKNYLIQTLKDMTFLAGEALYNHTEIKYSAEEACIITQIIAEWIFHKSVDIIKAEIPNKYRDQILQKIAYTIYELATICVQKNIEQEAMLNLIEKQVAIAYVDSIKDLQKRKCISKKVAQTALNESNVTKMVAKRVADSKTKVSITTILWNILGFIIAALGIYIICKRSAFHGEAKVYSELLGSFLACFGLIKLFEPYVENVSRILINTFLVIWGGKVGIVGILWLYYMINFATHKQ